MSKLENVHLRVCNAAVTANRALIVAGWRRAARRDVDPADAAAGIGRVRTGPCGASQAPSMRLISAAFAKDVCM